MGLKTKKYNIKKLGITIPDAYAICEQIFSDESGKTFAHFGIYQKREDAFNETIQPIETYSVSFTADKSQPLFEQAYLQAKSDLFTQWKDDIVPQENIDSVE